MAVDLAGDMGEMALDLAQFRAIQGAAKTRRDERNQEKGISIFFGVRSMRRGGTIFREVSRLQVGAVIIGRFSPGLN